MTNQELKKRKDYFAKVRLANYRASMKLEGIDVSKPTDAQDKAKILAKYRTLSA
ncbi:YhfG family protein [Zooshikella ganghwensis]|uniref:DUF2559 family protein n=1 Tax=Zooshikella ganghwensis TaxID=202772 RepID=A0A4P9VEJ1_9GAMM|nr:YhfG family protein [Zooshikella ganghwensis]RDH41475.1 DUF2559 family protein [Zooshikella ganghwensis]RDH41581.1 DUF2559 family protein [Zooshikella ganghwensis]